MRRPLSIAMAALALALAGCGEPSDTTPVACLEGTGAYLKALGDAPGSVRLRGESPIGDCLVENQKAGDLATVGTAMVAAATKLNAEARAEPGGDADLQLGYLLGAAERGAERTDGIHAELIRRLSAAARYSTDNRPLPPAFLSTYREGFDAGEARG
ncbi:MAG TPA: hypothetical protein VHR65_03880 [Solirubrobacterales bacterium]|jgi:hypothetical protein|nr:hypothetical protein [Solirubrobacterales bacterium]